MLLNLDLGQAFALGGSKTHTEFQELFGQTSLDIGPHCGFVQPHLTSESRLLLTFCKIHSFGLTKLIGNLPRHAFDPSNFHFDSMSGIISD
jgi:hypothetical protein